jgi:DNA-binding NarL/FixJ family response regulator
MNPSGLRIVLVGLDPIAARALRQELEEATGLAVVGAAGEERDALDVIAATGPHVILLDADAPWVDTLSFVAQVGGGAHVVLLADHEDSELVVEALMAGADGALVKGMPTDELGDALRAVTRGEAAVSTSVATMLVERLRRL